MNYNYNSFSTPKIEQIISVAYWIKSLNKGYAGIVVSQTQYIHYVHYCDED